MGVIKRLGYSSTVMTKRPKGPTPFYNQIP
jgi:hypothetical protein